MAKKGYIVESRIAATNVDSYNRTAVCANSDVDGGVLLELGDMTGDVFAGTIVTATGKTGLWMAYNPSEHFTDVNGKIFAGLSADPRDYTNLKGRPIDVFKPQVGDLVVFTEGNIATASVAGLTKGDYLEPGANGQFVKKAGSPTASTTSFKVQKVGTMPFPQAGIGQEAAKTWLCECVQN